MMAYDFTPLLTVPAAEAATLVAEENVFGWAIYGRHVHKHLTDPRFMVALNDALMKGRGAPDIQRRIITFLTTGTIAS